MKCIPLPPPVLAPPVWVLVSRNNINTVCLEYDKWRPTYVKEVYDDIFNAKEINSLSNVLLDINVL